MDWLLTPQFVVQLLWASFTAGGVYMGVRMDLKHMHEKIDEEKRLREAHAKEDDDSFHDIRGSLQEASNRIATIEGRIGGMGASRQ